MEGLEFRDGEPALFGGGCIDEAVESDDSIHGVHVALFCAGNFGEGGVFPEVIEGEVDVTGDFFLLFDEEDVVFGGLAEE